MTGILPVTYSYDAWGNILSVTGPRADNLGKLNPLRYRGYVYDLDPNLAEFSLATATGAVSGAIGGSGADGAKLRDVSKIAKHVITNSSSAKKVAMYTAKQAAVKKTIAISTGRTIAAGLTSNYINSKRKQLAKILAL